MSGMRTIGDEPKIQMEYDENYALSIGFPTASTILFAGQIVKLNTDGTVSAVAATTDKPFGPIVSAYRGVSKGKVRVLVPYCAILSNAVADGALDAGDYVAASGLTGGGLPKFKKAVAGDYVVGQAIKPASSTATAKIGILRTPALAVIPAP